MLTVNGAGRLATFAKNFERESFTQVAPGVWHLFGGGHSNAVIIEGDTGTILVDSLDTLERGELLRERIRQTVGKPVKALLYTHSHPDHLGGAGAFDGDAPEIIAFAPKTPPLARAETLREIQALRGGRQFGYALSDEEAVTQGLGPREGIVRGESRAPRVPTTLYKEDAVRREICGVRLELRRLPGETDDQMAIWLPEKGVLCCGDNYYGCWPNLYAVRGGQYRDIAAWVDSLDVLLSYGAEHLLPGHTRPISGRKRVAEVLGNYRGAIDYLLKATLEGMNQGRTADELAAAITLPEPYASLPYLGEFYGSVDWTVRAIYTGYLGWFDGNPTHLHPLSPAERGGRAVALMGGPAAVLAAEDAAFGEGAYQACLELCDLLLDAGLEVASARRRKAAALRRLADWETSANGRHYYLTCARELEAAE